MKISFFLILSVSIILSFYKNNQGGILSTFIIFLFVLHFIRNIFSNFSSTINLDKLSFDKHITYINSEIYVGSDYLGLYLDDLLDIVSLIREKDYFIQIGNYEITNEDNILESLDKICEQDGKLQKKFYIETNSFIYENFTISAKTNDVYDKGIILEIRDIIKRRTLGSWHRILLRTVFPFIMVVIFSVLMIFLVGKLIFNIYLFYIGFIIGSILITYITTNLYFKKLTLSEPNIYLYNYNKRPLITKQVFNILVGSLITSLIGVTIGAIMSRLLEYIINFF